MKASFSISWCVLTLTFLLRLHQGRTLKSNDIATFRMLDNTSKTHDVITHLTARTRDVNTLDKTPNSRDVTKHLQGSRSRTTNCPVLPPCSCVQPSQSAHQGPPSRVRVTCDSSLFSRHRRVLRFHKSSVITRSFERLSLAYAGLNALSAATFRHIKVTIYLISYRS